MNRPAVNIRVSNLLLKIVAVAFLTNAGLLNSPAAADDKIIGPDIEQPVDDGIIRPPADVPPPSEPRKKSTYSPLDIYDKEGNVITEDRYVGVKSFKINVDVEGLEALVTYSLNGFPRKTEKVPLPGEIRLTGLGETASVVVNSPGYSPNGLDISYEEMWKEKTIIVQIDDPFLAFAEGRVGVDRLKRPELFCQQLPRKGSMIVISDRTEVYAEPDEKSRHRTALFEGMYVAPIGEPVKGFVRIGYCQGAAKEGYTRPSNLQSRQEYIHERQPEVIGTLVEKKQVIVGMTRDDVLQSWGEPYKKSTLYSGEEQWCYITPPGRSYLSFRGGQLILMQVY